MPLILPTDTQYMKLQTRQYELFNRPLGQGIERRKLFIFGAVCGVWIVLLLAWGVPILDRWSTFLYIAPPVGLCVLGTRIDDSGRMAMLGWCDALLARMPARRRVLTNPLLLDGTYRPSTEWISTTTEIARRPVDAACITRRSHRAQAQAGKAAA